MRALVRCTQGRPRLALADVAGLPLLVRQLQWLHAAGVDEVAVEIGADSDAAAVIELLEREFLGRRVRAVLTSQRVAIEELARRAGFPAHESLVVLGDGFLADVDLATLWGAQQSGGLLASLRAPDVVGLSGGELRIHAPGSCVAMVRGRGWGVDLRDEADAHLLGMAAVAGALPREICWPIAVHAAELRPGVFVGRGAHVDPRAKLHAPVLVGAGAYVAGGATVGPSAILGRDAIVERDATVASACVPDFAVIDAGVVVRGRVHGVAGPTAERVRPPLAPRVIAFGLLAVLVVLALLVVPLAASSSVVSTRLARRLGPPLARGRSLARRLVEGVAGTRALVGIGSPALPSGEASEASEASEELRARAAEAPAGILDIEPALVLEGSSGMSRLRARAWYAQHKSPLCDARLVLESCRARFTRSAPAR